MDERESSHYRCLVLLEVVRETVRERERFVMKRKVEGMSHTHTFHIYFIYMYVNNNIR